VVRKQTTEKGRDTVLHLDLLTDEVMDAYEAEAQKALLKLRGGATPDFSLNRLLTVRSHGRVWTVKITTLATCDPHGGRIVAHE
jgi:hypothetical protein